MSPTGPVRWTSVARGDDAGERGDVLGQRRVHVADELHWVDLGEAGEAVGRAMTPLAPRRREGTSGADRRRWYLGSADGERMRSVGRAVVPARERGTPLERIRQVSRVDRDRRRGRTPSAASRPGCRQPSYTASHHVAPAFSSSTASVAASAMVQRSTSPSRSRVSSSRRPRRPSSIHPRRRTRHRRAARGAPPWKVASRTRRAPAALVRL